MSTQTDAWLDFLEPIEGTAIGRFKWDDSFPVSVAGTFDGRQFLVEDSSGRVASFPAPEHAPFSFSVSSATINVGRLASGDVSGLEARDSVFFSALQGPSFVAPTSKFVFTFEGVCPVMDPRLLTFTVSQKLSASNANVRLEFYNWVTSRFVQAGFGQIEVAELDTFATIENNHSFVSTLGKVRVRMYVNGTFAGSVSDRLNFARFRCLP
ncbi:MAG: hypothetical protein JNM34_02210 [Chthonomonadaceae bacterium]|nr:hypothetical protein [Chthonomonadaceae bacterium]